MSATYTYNSNARERDAETGMYFYRARYYSPTLARFITEDPIRFASGDLNWYRYVGNDPVNLIDPLGLTSWPTDSTQTTKEFGDRGHTGLDMVNPKGSPVYSTDSGTVIRVYSSKRGGGQIKIRNCDGSISGYAHTGAIVSEGQKVDECQVIGYSDGKGDPSKGFTRAHLHYTYRFPGVAVDGPTSNPSSHINPSQTCKKKEEKICKSGC